MPNVSIINFPEDPGAIVNEITISKLIKEFTGETSDYTGKDKFKCFGFTPHATFNNRRDSRSVKKQNQILFFDLDIDDPNKSDIKNDYNINPIVKRNIEEDLNKIISILDMTDFFFCIKRSISKCGIHMFLRYKREIELEPENRKTLYRNISNYLQLSLNEQKFNYKWKFDTVGELSRPCFISKDEKAIIEPKNILSNNIIDAQSISTDYKYNNTYNDIRSEGEHDENFKKLISHIKLNDIELSNNERLQFFYIYKSIFNNTKDFIHFHTYIKNIFSDITLSKMAKDGRTGESRAEFQMKQYYNSIENSFYTGKEITTGTLYHLLKEYKIPYEKVVEQISSTNDVLGNEYNINITLKEKQYISDYDTKIKEIIEDNNKIILKAPPGTGKSRYLIKYLIKLLENTNITVAFIAPKNSILSQILNDDYNTYFNCIWKDGRNNPKHHDKSRFYLSNYYNMNKLPKVNLIIVDECHDLVEYTSFENIIDKDMLKYDKIIYTSATPEIFLIGEKMEEFFYLNFNSKKKPKIKYVITPDSKKDQLMKLLIPSEMPDKNKKGTFIYLNNKTEIDDYETLLSGHTSQKQHKITQDTKDEQTYIKLTTTQFIPDNSICYGTDLINEGVNFKNTNWYQLIMMNQYGNSIFKFYQMSHRFRIGNPYLRFISDKLPGGKSLPLDNIIKNINYNYKVILKNIIEKCDLYNNSSHIPDKDAKTLIDQQLIYEIDGNYYPYHYKLKHKVYNDFENSIRMNYKLMTEFIKKYFDIDMMIIKDDDKQTRAPKVSKQVKEILIKCFINDDKRNNMISLLRKRHKMLLNNDLSKSYLKTWNITIKEENFFLKYKPYIYKLNERYNEFIKYNIDIRKYYKKLTTKPKLWENFIKSYQQKLVMNTKDSHLTKSDFQYKQDTLSILNNKNKCNIMKDSKGKEYINTSELMSYTKEYNDTKSFNKFLKSSGLIVKRKKYTPELNLIGQRKGYDCIDIQIIDR